MWFGRIPLYCLSVSLLQAGCGGGASREDPPATGGPGVPVPSPTGVSVPPTWQGRFFGTVTIGGEELQTDVLLTEDGLIRLAFGWPGPSSGVVPDTRPEDPAQFVGDFVVHGTAVSGSGNIYGEGCAGRDTGFCGQTLSATFTLDNSPGTPDVPGMVGEIRVDTAAGTEVWTLDLSAWKNYYVLRAEPGGLTGSYTELLAEFVGDADAVMTVDATGEVFFQSAATGCVGTGRFTPHLNGNWNVYDVDLQVGNCVAPYDYLNGDFEGLATTSATDAWAYDSAIRTWLTRPPGSQSPAAVTTWAPYNY